MSEQVLAETIGAVLDKHIGWQMHRGEMIEDLCAVVAADRAAAFQEAADEADGVGHHWSGAPALAFFALAGDLRARAAELDPRVTSE